MIDTSKYISIYMGQYCTFIACQMSKLISSAQRVVEHAGGRVKKLREVEGSGRRKGREGGGRSGGRGG